MTPLLLIALLGLVAYLLLRVIRLERQLREGGADLRDELREWGDGLSDGLFGRLEGWLSLRDRLDLRQGLPYTPRWSAGPDFLKLIVDHCLEARPRTVLECSSGVTTLMLARCCQLNGGGRLISLENGEEYAAASRGHIARYGLDGIAEVVHAPLSRHELRGREYQWYALDRLPEAPIEMLVIDGPPGFLQPHSRYPALPLLHERLADGCKVFLDDAGRPDERELVAWWLEEFPGTSHQYVETERGCSILTIRKGG